MSDMGIVFTAIAFIALIYALCRLVDDWLKKGPGLVPSSNIALLGILALLLWYGVHYTRNAMRALPGCDGTAMGLLSLFLLLFALILWQARKG